MAMKFKITDLQEEALAHIIERLERAEITPQLLSETRPIELFIYTFRGVLGYEACLKDVMMGFGLIGSKDKAEDALRELPEGFKLLVQRKAFETFLKRLITVIRWLRGERSFDMKGVIDKIIEVANLPPEEACKALNEKVKAAKRNKRLRPRLIKVILILGMKAALYWQRYYGLTLPERARPEEELEDEESEAYHPCLAYQVSSGL